MSSSPLHHGQCASPTWKQSTGLKYLCFVIVAAALTTFIFQRHTLVTMRLADICNIASAIALGCIVTIVVVCQRGIWSAPSIYIIIFSLFHFGLTSVYGIGMAIPEEIQINMNQWFFLPSTIEAILLSSAGILAFGLGVCIMNRQSRWRVSVNTVAVEREAGFDHLVGGVGLVTLLASILSWMVIVISSGGLSLFIGSYEQYLDATAQYPMPIVQYGIGLGLCFVSASSHSRLRTIGFLAFGVWSLIGFPIGLRGEVLFPTAAALVIIAKHRPLLSPIKALLCGIVLLAAIAAVKDLRQVGIQNAIQSDLRYNPLGGLAELGGSLRPVTEVVQWYYQGEPYIHGASYLAPLERAFSKIFPVIDRKPALDDDRIMNILVNRRVGPIGFSPIAEAYRNEGWVGVCLYMFLLGVLLSWIDRWPPTTTHQCMLGIILVPILNQIRNDFVPIPSHMFMGSLILLVLIIVSRRSRYHDEPMRQGSPEAFYGD